MHAEEEVTTLINGTSKEEINSIKENMHTMF